MDKKYDIGLDLIRIFAMTGVLMVHLAQVIPIVDVIKPLFSWGASGVQVFFVLSGFLAAYSFRDHTPVITYYKKRAKRILPAYYFVVVVSIIFHEFILLDVTQDIFHIGWIRYFFGLNTILPSDNYYLWNNVNGLWTMSCFIWFYIMAPLIFKVVKSLKGSMGLFIVSFALKYANKLAVYILFSRFTGVEETLDILQGASPLGTLYQFAIGIMAYYAIKQGAEYCGTALMTVIAVGGVIIHQEKLVWCALSGIMIISVKHININVPEKLRKIVEKVGKESYHIYLAHLLAFSIAKYILKILDVELINTGYVLWALFVLIIIVIMCQLMNWVEKIIMVKSKGK